MSHGITEQFAGSLYELELTISLHIHVFNS